jgi:site-specific DNA-methyltransferase (adenine-specific)
MTKDNKKQKLSDSTDTAIAYSTCYVQPFSEVFNEDCIQVMKRYPDKFFDLAVVDPPYGIGAGKRVGTTYKEGVLRNKKGFGNTKLYTAKNWDNEVPTAEYWNELFRVSKNQIAWGGNYFTQYLPESRGWIYWDKKIINHQIDNYSDGELAWTSFDTVLRKVTYDWIGLGYCNSSEKGTRIHPTHKPIFLYEWILQKYAKPNDLILDTHLGSGSSRIASHKAGLSFVGCEIDKDYFDAQEKRFKEFVSQLRLF